MGSNRGVRSGHRGRPSVALIDAPSAPERRLDAALAALASSEANFRTFFETIDDIIVVGSLDGKIVYSNPALRRTLGFDPDEVLGTDILSLHPPGRRAEAEEIYAAMWSGERSTCPLPLQAKSGALVPVETRVWFGRWNGEDCVFGVCKDLTVEQEALQKFDRLFRSSPSPMAVSLMPERRLTDVNDAWIRATGYTRAEALGRTSADLGLFPDARVADEIARQMRTGRVADVEVPIRRRDGTLIDGVFCGEVIESQGRRFFLSVFVDQTERRRAEQALLLQAQRMESIGQFASGIAHDFKNILTIIDGNAVALHEALAADDPSRHTADEIREAAARGAELSRQLLAFGRRRAGDPQILVLDVVVDDIQRMLRRLLGSRVKLIFQAGAPDGRVLADAARIGQVLMNLAVNARDAMPDGGTLSIQTTDVRVDDGAGAREQRPGPGRYVVLIVADTGVGMDAETRGRAFEPFFTTKGPDQGSGLGLTTVRTIVSQAGGTIGIDSEPGRGTTVTVWLPAVDGVAPAGPSPTARRG